MLVSKKPFGSLSQLQACSWLECECCCLGRHSTHFNARSWGLAYSSKGGLNPCAGFQTLPPAASSQGCHFHRGRVEVMVSLSLQTANSFSSQLGRTCFSSAAVSCPKVLPVLNFWEMQRVPHPVFILVAKAGLAMIWLENVRVRLLPLGLRKFFYKLCQTVSQLPLSIAFTCFFPIVSFQ